MDLFFSVTILEKSLIKIKSDFSDFIRLFPTFRLFQTFRLSGSTALIMTHWTHLDLFEPFGPIFTHLDSFGPIWTHLDAGEEFSVATM